MCIAVILANIGGGIVGFLANTVVYVKMFLCNTDYWTLQHTNDVLEKNR